LEGAENETGVPTAAILSPVLPIIMQQKFSGFESSDCSFTFRRSGL
jgi:hypothetical protein